MLATAAAARAPKKLKDLYNFTRPVDDHRLGVAHDRSEILSKIEASLVTIISGQTGCGKTTQIPYYILQVITGILEYFQIRYGHRDDGSIKF